MKDRLIVLQFIAILGYTYTAPSVNLFIMNNINSDLISFDQIITCIATIIVNSVWNKYSTYLHKYMKIIIILNMLIFAIAYTYVIITLNIVVFYILKIIIISTIIRHVECISNIIKSSKYKNEDRAKFDNNIQISSAIATIIGSCIGLIYVADIRVMFVILYISNFLDDISYYLEISK